LEALQMFTSLQHFRWLALLLHLNHEAFLSISLVAEGAYLL